MDTNDIEQAEEVDYEGLDEYDYDMYDQYAEEGVEAGSQVRFGPSYSRHCWGLVHSVRST